MKHTVVKTSLMLIAAMSVAGTSHAQFSSLKNKLKNKAENEVVRQVDKELTKAVTSDAPAAAAPSAPASTASKSAASSSPQLGTPASNLISMTKCASLRPTNILVGTQGNYTFQDGFTTEKRTGFINRRSASLSNGCLLPSLNPGEAVYMEVDTNKYKAMGSSNDWDMQCLWSDNPSKGAVSQTQGKTEYPYHVKAISAKNMMLHCGHSESNVNECAEGSNSSRATEWTSKVKARGNTSLSVMATSSTLAPAQGEKLYCQYYNKKSREALFAFEYLRTRN